MPNTVPAAAIGLPTSRRTILRGLTALPLAGVPAVALATTVSPDPIFTAIEKHKAALAFFEKVLAPSAAIVGGGPPELQEAVDAASDAEQIARYDMHETVPQTVAGLAAYVAYWNGFVGPYREDGCNELQSIGWEAIPTIAEAVARLFSPDGIGSAA